MVKLLSSLIFVNIVFLGRKNKLLLVRKFIELRAHLTIFCYDVWVLLESLRKVALIILSSSLMISKGVSMYVKAKN